jgi:Pycsar effector protein
MEIQQKINLMEQSLARLLQMESNADSKLSIIVAIDTSMLFIEAVLTQRGASAPAWVFATAAVAGGCLLLSLLSLSFCALPRTTKTTSSVVFFGSIARNDRGTYSGMVKILTEEGYLDDLISQCHRNAQIASTKYTWIQRAQGAWFASILPWLLTVYGIYSHL